MHRQIAAIFFLLAFAVHNLNQVVIVLDYYTNTASFAKNCENKARPQMRCHGKCQMGKMLKEAEKKETQNPVRKAARSEELALGKTGVNVPPLTMILLPKPYSDRPDVPFPKGACTDIFHPPAAA